jgi:glycosyltransferase involved in cell wall biosynthesis
MVSEGPSIWSEVTPRVSVVIPCRDGADTILEQLHCVTQQDAQVPFEVVVADNGSRDGTREIVQAFAEESSRAVSIVDASASSGINVARNAGVRASRGELVLLCDADDLVAEGWLQAYWDAYSGGAELLGGALERVASRAVDRAKRVSGINDHLDFLPWPQGANCGFARHVFDEIEGFDETYRGGGDETDFFWRAQLLGRGLVEVPGACITYSERSDMRGLWRQQFVYGQSQVLLFRRFRTRGMPRSSSLAALRFWLALPVRLASVTLDGRASHREVVSALARRCGRLRAMLALRTWYL